MTKSILYEIVDLPVAATPSAVGKRMHELAALQIPGFVAPDAGETLGEALDIVRLDLPPSVTFDHEMPGPFFPDGSRVTPVGHQFHLDRPPGHGPLTHVSLNFHFTGLGEGVGSFLVPTASYVEQLRAEGTFAMPRSDRVRFDKGQVDPERYAPVCYRSLSRKGTLLVFSGDILMHSFSTTKAPRIPLVLLARMALQPALAV